MMMMMMMLTMSLLHLPSPCIQTDLAFALYLIGSGLSFREAENPLLLAFLKAFKDAPDTYVLPSRKVVAGRLLDQVADKEHAFLMRVLQDSADSGCGFTLVTDGMTYQHVPYMNIVGITSSVGAVHVKTIDCTRRMQQPPPNNKKDAT